jgi:hypothetical protein
MDRPAEASGVFVPSITTADSPPLTDAWKTAIRSFCAWLPRHAAITGVRTRPELSPERKPIPGAWASDAQIDFHVSALTIGDVRYSAVEIAERSDDVRAQAPISELTHRDRTTPEPITAESVRRATTEELVLIHEELYQRVIKEPDAKVMAPGKTSVMPLVARMMRERAASGALLPTRKAEALYLAKWIKEKAPTHQTPTAATIEKVLGTEYAVLRERSKAEIQSSEK